MREGWRRVTLGHIFELTNQRVGDHDEEPEVFSVTKYDGFVPALEYFGKRVASEALHKYKTVGPDEWAYSTIHIDEGSIARNTLGRAGVVSPMYTTMRVVTAEVEPFYLELLLRSPQMLAVYSDTQQGSINRRRSLPWKSFVGIEVDVPPLVEQRRIADVIAALDRQLVVTDKVGSRLERLWWALAGQLEFEAAGNETVPLGNIAAIHGGLTKNKKDTDRDDAMEVPYLRVANVLRHRLDLSEISTIVASRLRIEASQLEPGDLLMAEGGDRDKLGRGAVWRGEVKGCTHQNHVFRARITDEAFLPEFVSSWANGFGKQWFDVHGSQTTGIASISKTTLSRFPVPRLSMKDQERWVELLDGVIRQEDLARAEAARLRTLRANLLTTLLSGEHEIPETYDELLEEAAA